MSGEPWLAKKWSAGRLADENRFAGCIVSGVALVWNAIAWTITLPVLLNPNEGAGRFFVLLFPLIGIVLAAVAVHQVLRRRRYGSPVFELATLPGVVGRALAGQVLIQRGLDPESDFALLLKCSRTIVTGSGKQRRTRETVLWESKQQLPGALASGGGLRVPVAFAIPPEAEPTDERNSRDMVRWFLEIRSAVPGVDFTAKFELPVFRTAESATPLSDDERRRLGA